MPVRSDSTFDAIFEFEAELSLKAFMTQRRRWINGTIAGCIYALSQAPAIARSPQHTPYFKAANVLLLVLQVGVRVSALALGPGARVPGCMGASRAL